MTRHDTLATAPSAERGNVLFLILIAVALFAALSYAVTTSTRSGGGNADAEKRALNTAEINSFLSSVQTGITRINVGQGTQIHDISFNNNAYFTHSDVALPDPLGTPVNPGNHLFHPEGGGIIPRTFEQFSTPCTSGCAGMAKPGHVTFHWMSIPEIGSARGDAVMLLNFMSEATCLAFNDKVGVSYIPTLSLGEEWLPTSTEDSPTITNPNAGPDLAEAEGRNMMCYEQDGSPGAYMLYLVIREF